MSKSREQSLITKEDIYTYVTMHTNFILLFKPAIYSSTLGIKVTLSRNSYYNTKSLVLFTAIIAGIRSYYMIHLSLLVVVLWSLSKI